MDSTPQERLEMRWLPVLDESGRTRMEATWVTVPGAPGASSYEACLRVEVRRRA